METETNVGLERFMIPALQDVIGRKNSGRNRSELFKKSNQFIATFSGMPLIHEEASSHMVSDYF
jgi:hypothetical protein